MTDVLLTKHQKDIAIFRFGVISDIVNGTQMSRKQRHHLIQEKSLRKWQIPYSEKTAISIGTIYRWIRLYRDNGNQLESLCPGHRSDRHRVRAWDDETANAVIEFRKQNPDQTIQQLIDQMHKADRVTPGIILKPTTVYRFLHAHELMDGSSSPVDRRRFEAALSNDLWQSDVMHGPRVAHDGKQRKTYLIAMIDDHSRLIPYARFYLSEGITSYLDALYHAISRRGLPRKLYVDNGSAFRSHKLQYVTASLGINLIHAKPYQPQGKGKIERWFKTVRSMFLHKDYQPQTHQQLNDDFAGWLDATYHQRIHSSTGEKPLNRFTQQMHCIRSAPEPLADYFRTISLRKVNKDRTVVIDGRLFEAPVALVGRRIELHYHDSDPDRVEAVWKQQSYGLLTRVSVHVNCRVKRDKNNNPSMDVHDADDYSGGTLFESKPKA